MKKVTVYAKTGETWGTSINPKVSDDEIRQYFIGQIFNLGGVDDKLVTVARITISGEGV